MLFTVLLSGGQSKQTEYETLLFCMVILLAFLCDSFCHQHHVKIPEGGSTILIGVFMGLIDYLAGGNMNEVISFNSNVFHLILLPLIIFNAGYSLRKQGLFGNLGTIVTYALVGTLVSALIIGFAVYQFFVQGWGAPGTEKIEHPYEPLMFGALISAVDPVASLAVFSAVFKVGQQKHTPLLYHLVFGESVLNDAVAIVVFKSFETFISTPYEGFNSVCAIFGEFLLVSFASLAIGVALACFTALIFKFTPLAGNVTHELFFVLLMSYGAYVLAEALSFSGIMAIFFCAILQAHYTWYNLSDFGKIFLPRTFHALAHVSETIVFAYLGMAIFAFHSDHDWDLPFICFVMLMCFIGRAFAVFPLTVFINMNRKRRKISFAEQVVLWFSGLRGAIAFMLALQMKDVVTTDKNGDQTVGTANAAVYVSTTLVIVMLTTFICGGLTETLLKVLGLDQQQEEESVEVVSRNIRKFHELDRKMFQSVLCLPPDIDVDKLADVLTSSEEDSDNSMDDVVDNDDGSVLDSDGGYEISRGGKSKSKRRSRGPSVGGDFGENDIPLTSRKRGGSRAHSGAHQRSIIGSDSESVIQGSCNHADTVTVLKLEHRAAKEKRRQSRKNSQSQHMDQNPLSKRSSSSKRHSFLNAAARRADKQAKAIAKQLENTGNYRMPGFAIIDETGDDLQFSDDEAVQNRQTDNYQQMSGADDDAQLEPHDDGAV